MLEVRYYALYTSQNITDVPASALIGTAHLQLVHMRLRSIAAGDNPHTVHSSINVTTPGLPAQKHCMQIRFTCMLLQMLEVRVDRADMKATIHTMPLPKAMHTTGNYTCQCIDLATAP